MNLWDVKVQAAEVEKLIASMKKTNAKPTKDQRYLMDGYYRGVTHNDATWTT